MVRGLFCKVIVDFRAVGVEYLELCDKYSIGWTAEASSRQGAKPACRFAF